MSKIIIIGMENNHPFILNVLEIVFNISSVFSPVASLKLSPIIKKMISVMINDGIVVYVMYLMCVNKSVPEDTGARFVVSERGDILSPKYAPEIIAPAINPIGKPRAFPIPNNAIPIVAIVLHELPVAKDTIAEIIAVANKKKFGFNI